MKEDLKEERILLTTRIHSVNRKVRESLMEEISPFEKKFKNMTQDISCLLYTSPSPRDS